MPVSHYENFPVASLLLPHRLREPVEAIYAFARTADDIADEGDACADERLSALLQMSHALHALEAGQTPQSPLLQRLAHAVRRHRIPLAPLHDLLDAFRQDVTRTRYAHRAELLDYCRRSANPVGRLMLHLYGADTEENRAWSDDICTALQLINFWQDVAIDWRKGRLYLPADSLARFGVTEAQIAAGRTDAAWKALMAYETGFARSLMLRGGPLARSLPGRVGLELRLVVCGGLRVLERIAAIDFDVLHQRPVLTWRDWLHLVPQAFLRFPSPQAVHPALSP